MKNLPTEIKIGNRDITVEVIKMEDTLLGQYDPNALVISLNETNSPTQMLETFWHELIHAINDFNRLTFEIQNEMDTGDGSPEGTFGLEERITEDFAVTFLMVIQDNNLINLTGKK